MLSTVIVNQSALNGLKNKKVVILTCEQENVGYQIKKFDNSNLQALFDEDEAQTQQQLADVLLGT